MKSILFVLVSLSVMNLKTATISMCQKVAETAAVNYMDSVSKIGLTDGDGKPIDLDPAEKATITQVNFLNSQGEVTDKESGNYGVVMGVM